MTMNTCSDNKHMYVSNSSQHCIKDATRTPIRKSLEGINKTKWRSGENVFNGTRDNSQCLHISSLSSTSSSNFNEGNICKDITRQSCSLALSSPSSTVRAESSTTHLSTNHNAKLSSSPFMSRTKSSIARLSTNNKAKSSSQSPTMSRTETSIACMNTNNNSKLSPPPPSMSRPETATTHLSPNHNAARERSRVKTLRAAFLELQRRLPAVPEDTKLSKLDVLVLATTYIAHLTSTLATHSVNAASNTNTRNILIHHQNQSTTAPPTAIHHAVQWTAPTSNNVATDGGSHCKLQAKDRANDKTNIRHKHVQTSGGEGTRTKSYNAASGGSLSRGYLRPVKKWPMRSRLYTGIMASTNAGRKY